MGLQLPAEAPTEGTHNGGTAGSVVSAGAACWNVIGLLGLPIKAPHLAYMYALTMPDQYHLVFPNSYLFMVS